jgi:hypothetical protein
MGDVIYFNPNDEDPFAELEKTITEILERYDDADSAPWVIQAIQRMCEIPELSFQLSVNFPSDLGEDRSKEINDMYAAQIKERVEKIKYGIIQEFLENYFEKAMTRYRDR